MEPRRSGGQGSRCPTARKFFFRREECQPRGCEGNREGYADKGGGGCEEEQKHKERKEEDTKTENEERIRKKEKNKNMGMRTGCEE